MSKESKSHCFTDLIRRILSLELAPGADLDEASLAQHYGISRTPLREVLQKLAGLGYVQTSSNRGAVVSSMNVSVMRVFFRTAPTVYAHISRLAAEQG
ncbi:MAG: GntR family transcriptional regulator, partial [Pseudomonadota bacterium]